MENTCFVIQPFNEKFNQRYEDIIKPAIEECGLIPYRVDEDVSVMIPIESIHNAIRKSCMCVAEITTNNPNVWYEVGYAMALDIPIVLMCSDERTEQYPFDVRHRNILQYKTVSLKDYHDYKNTLINRLFSLLDMKQNKKSENSNLTDVESKILFLIAKYQMLPNQIISHNDIKNNSIDKEEFILTLRKLVNSGFILYNYAIESGVTNSYYQLTQKAEEWIAKHT